NNWGDDCVMLVELTGCGFCDGGEAACCVAQDTPGCGNAGIEQCVCDQDPFCCEEQWDPVCVDKVEGLGCGTCGGAGGDCCAPGMGPGCEDLGVQTCVCEVAPSCCQVHWSDACAALVDALGCGVCGGGTGCCEA